MNPQNDKLTPGQQRFFIWAFFLVFLCFTSVLGAGVWKTMRAQEKTRPVLLTRQDWSRQPKQQHLKKSPALPRNIKAGHVIRGRAGLVKFLMPYKNEGSEYRWLITLPNGSKISDAAPAGYVIIQPDSYAAPTAIKLTGKPQPNSACAENAPPYVHIQVTVPTNAPLGHYQVISIVPAGWASDSPYAQSCSPDASQWYKGTFSVVERPVSTSPTNGSYFRHQ